MSAFEKLPREIRDVIYGFCLIYNGDIKPYPNSDEREQIRANACKPAKYCTGRIGLELGDEMKIRDDLRSCGGIKYVRDWPSIALLGVNKGIQKEAASVLFNNNVWRLSFVDHWDYGEEKDFWYSYQNYFRHISNHMSLNDTSDRLRCVKGIRAVAKRKEWSRSRLETAIHKENFRTLDYGLEWKQELLAMMNLKSLLFNIENFFYPQGCYRKRVLYLFCQQMGQDGPWHKLEVDVNAGRIWVATTQQKILDVEAKRKADVKVVGLEDGSEKEIFMTRWGLEVD